MVMLSVTFLLYSFRYGGGGEGREAREGGLMQMGREGTRQCSLPRSSVFILPLNLLLVNKKLFF